MNEIVTPTLEDLREVPEAAWLWDGVRGRIVWANGEGIRFFGGASLFDLIDRPFDFLEPGVEKVAALARTLRRGQVEEALLDFPSTGAGAPLSCRCMIHALADGRPGLLVVARSTAPETLLKSTEDMALAFDNLPSATVLVGRDGSIRHLNAAALLLLGAGQRASLEGLMGERAAADELLARVEAAGTCVVQRPLTVRLGKRDIRLIARLLDRTAEGRAFAMVLLDDVTERRALELELTKAGAQAERPVEVTPPALTGADADVFARLGKTLEDGIRHVPRREPEEERPAAGGETPSAKTERRSFPLLPPQVRAALEARKDAVLVVKDSQIVFGNPAAARLLGLKHAEDIINDRRLSERFSGLSQSLPATEVVGEDGQAVFVSVHLSNIPWFGGPARMLVLRPAAAPSERVALKLAPAVPEPSSDLPRPEPAAPPADMAAAGGEVVTMPSRPGPIEADEELRAILDTATDGIITLDAQGHIHTFSAGAEAIFGYRIADVAGKPLVELLASDSRKTVRDYLAALQGPGLASVFNDGREVEAVVRQGGTVPLFLTIGRLQAPRSQAAFCAVVRDITQWKKTEADLREAKEKAEATSRQKSEFLARISHELRTPLNAIMGFSEVMRLERFGEIDNEKYRGYVRDIHASGSHLLSLINDLLDLSKVEAGRLELNFTSVGIAEVVDHALRLMQEQATQARVLLRKALPADLPNVVADLRSMRQILLNLLSNAVKFTDPGGQVIVSAQVTAAGELKLRVKDTGIGMSPDQLAAAFEPFRRVATEGREAPGTGLGLPLTKALVEANRGTLAVTSEPRKGTLAEITFPTTRVLAG